MKPPLACSNCRARKKRCNRGYPICSYCLKTHDRCSYRIHGPSLKPHKRAVIPVTSGTSRGAALSTVAMFLDYPLFQTFFSCSFNGNVPIGAELREYVVDDNDLSMRVGAFMDIFDAWIPFLLRRELEETLLRRKAQPNGEEVLLLACIKSLSEEPREETAVTRQYLAIKSAFTGAEIAGVIKIGLLQALVLLLLYEFGHGLYPSAYVTLGTCVRYLVAVGVNGSGPCPTQDYSWIEGEKRRRLWWAVFVIERSMAFGCPQRPLSMPEPSKSHLLPSDEASWKQEIRSTIEYQQGADTNSRHHPPSPS
ncbi:hypothetical protein GQ53DRAFT_854890 [Thozetella sp. PMI_491]|nr:hypothetical protein GQ53DRAFT_854890 [Thozetella sp. PMI_491]